jgi:hypothetical protein
MARLGDVVEELKPGQARLGDVVENDPEDFDHTALAERMANGQKLYDKMKEAFGEHPAVLAPGGPTEAALRSIGFFPDPKRPTPLDPIFAMTEAGTRILGFGADMLLRGTAAGIAGAGEAVKQSAEHLVQTQTAKSINTAAEGAIGGPLIPTAEQMGRDTENFLDFLMTKTDPWKPTVGRVSSADGTVRAEPVGNAATPADVAAAARGIASGADHEVVSTKLRALYEEHGVHPNEVVADAAKDPALAADLASDSPVLPPRYTGFDPNAKPPKGTAEPKAGRIPDVSDDLNAAMQQRTEWPSRPIEPIAEGAEARPGISVSLGRHVAKLIDRTMPDIVRDAQIKTFPMAARDASVVARAAAKDFADAMRLARHDWQRRFDLVTKEFTEDRLKEMWDAADADSVAIQEGDRPTEVAKLAPRERGLNEAAQEHALDAFVEAVEVGIFKEDAEGLPSFMPRIVAWAEKQPAEGLVTALDPLGRNLKATTASARHRKYLTVEETEAAANRLGEKLGLGQASVVRDFRTLMLATAKLEEAIAGRRLVNAIKAYGKITDEPTVSVGAKPEGSKYRWFSLDHPAMNEYHVLLGRDEAGKFKAVLDERGRPQFKRVPVYIRSDFEGPMRAVLSQPNGPIYKALMEAKALASRYIMLSPLMHNQVIFGRAWPAMWGNPIATARLYWDGNKAKRGPIMREMIEGGLVPMSRNGAKMDVSSITQGPELGASIEAQVLGAIPNLFDPRAGKAVRTAVDKMGDFLHNTLLWDRVADLQAGLTKHYYEDLQERGFDPQTAMRMATHAGNRYAGVLPPEGMSAGARKIANVVLFSRSYALGLAGSIKDMFTGLPRDVLAQIERDQGVQTMLKARSFMQKRAIGIVAVDMALFYVAGSLAQSAFHVMMDDTTLEPDTREYLARMQKTYGFQPAGGLSRFLAEGASYADRARHVVDEVGHGRMINPVAMLGGLSPMSENEPGKDNRVLVGYQSDGTAIYMRMPVGKVGEEIVGMLTDPVRQAMSHVSTFVRPTKDVLENRDYAGRPIYNPHPEVPSDYLDTIAKIVSHMGAAQFPEKAAEAVWDLMTGTPTEDEKRVDVMQIVGTLTGFMFSKGYPGGPAGGVIAEQKETDKFQYSAVSVKLRKAVLEGRMDEAHQIMDKLRMDERFQQFTIDSITNPSARLVRKGMQKYIQGLPEYQQDRVNRFILQGQH